jgi:hypothetical protein
MALTVTDNRTIKDEADDNTPWTAAGTSTSTATGTADPYPIEATAHVVTTASSTSGAFQWLWHTGTSLGTGPHLIYIWCTTTAVIGLRSQGGLMLLLGDGTNRVGYNVGGSDVAPFRSDSGESATRVGYMCFVIDTAQLATWPHGANVQAGSRATLETNVNLITQVGIGCWVLAKAIGGAINFWADIIRHGVATNIATSGLTISGGTSGEPGVFREIAVEDRSSANQKAHGVIRELGEGTFGIQGTLRFGDQTTGSSWFEDQNQTIVFENRNLNSARYKIVITDNGTGTTTFKLGDKVGSGTSATGQNGCALISPTGVGALFDSGTDTNVTDVFIYGSTFSGFSNGIKLRTGQEFIGCFVNASGTLDAGGATLVNTSITASTATSALLWNVNTNTNALLDGMSFVSSGTGHAIELGSNTPTSIDFVGINFTNYASTDGSTGNEALYNNSGKSITVNITGGGSSPSVRNGTGASTTIVAGAVTVTLTAQTATGSVVQDAKAFVKASDATGPFPYQESVTIVNSGTTATVTHTSHGLATNDKVFIEGASLDANLGVFTITVTDTNTYTYTMLSTPGSSPTGTITSTFVVLKGLTDVNGQISMSRVFSSNQPFIGWARKSSAAPYYKEGIVTGTISSTTGASITALMIEDE